ncbi:MAG: OmpA family protein [Saprospiraceae bacterium]
MTALIIILCVILIAIVLVQIGKVTELTAQIKGQEEVMRDSSKWNGGLSIVFLVVFLVGVLVSAWKFRNEMLGYGPLQAASEHGGALDSLFNVTLFFTGIVFILTHIALFFFVYKYRWQKGRKSLFISHDNRLEVWWTLIPAVVMTVLVVRGLNAWNTVMDDIKDGEDYIEIEATGQQFNWIIRYPGADGKLGTRNHRLTTGTNQLGQDFTDRKNWDDFIPDQEFLLPVGKKVRVRITAKDVLHNFYLPHFRVKMDAVPGLPTYFVFTPIKTTAEYREELRKYPEYNQPNNPDEPDGPKRWEAFEYELACAELCGKSHYSMRRVLRVVSQEEYDAWLAQQPSYYFSQVRGKEGEDPNIGEVLDVEVGMRAAAFKETIQTALDSDKPEDKTKVLDYIWYESGSAALTANSKYELDNLVTAMNEHTGMVLRIGGHTDNTGEAEANMALSGARASNVVQYLIDRGVPAGRLQAVGYGDTKPIAENDTDANRAKNRRTEFTIISQ